MTRDIPKSLAGLVPPTAHPNGTTHVAAAVASLSKSPKLSSPSLPAASPRTSFDTTSTAATPSPPRTAASAPIALLPPQIEPGAGLIRKGALADSEEQVWRRWEREIGEVARLGTCRVGPAVRFWWKAGSVELAAHLVEECRRAAASPAQLALAPTPLWRLLANPVLCLPTGARDKDGRGVLLLNSRFWEAEGDGLAKMHWAARFLAEVAVEDPSTFLHGLTVISNADGCPDTVSLSDIHAIVLDLLVYTTPVKVARVLVVNAPWYWGVSSYIPSVSAVSAVAGGLVGWFGGAAATPPPPKAVERIEELKLEPMLEPEQVPVEVLGGVEELKGMVGEESLVEELGGTLEYDHEAWVREMVMTVERLKKHTQAIVPSKPPIPRRMKSLRRTTPATPPPPSPEPFLPLPPADAVQVTYRSSTEVKRADSVEVWERKVVEDGVTRKESVSRSVVTRIAEGSEPPLPKAAAPKGLVGWKEEEEDDEEPASRFTSAEKGKAVVREATPPPAIVAEAVAPIPSPPPPPVPVAVQVLVAPPRVQAARPDALARTRSVGGKVSTTDGEAQTLELPAVAVVKPDAVSSPVFDESGVGRMMVPLEEPSDDDEILTVGRRARPDGKRVRFASTKEVIRYEREEEEEEEKPPMPVLVPKPRGESRKYQKKEEKQPEPELEEEETPLIRRGGPGSEMKPQETETPQQSLPIPAAIPQSISEYLAALPPTLVVPLPPRKLPKDAPPSAGTFAIPHVNVQDLSSSDPGAAAATPTAAAASPAAPGAPVAKPRPRVLVKKTETPEEIEAREARKRKEEEEKRAKEAKEREEKKRKERERGRWLEVPTGGQGGSEEKGAFGASGGESGGSVAPVIQVPVNEPRPTGAVVPAVNVAVAAEPAANAGAPSANTVSFDAAMKVLEGLPKPVAAPRTARSRVSGTPADAVQEPTKVEVHAAAVATVAADAVPSTNTVSFDTAMKMLQGLPKPVAAPRTARSRGKVETAAKEEDEKVTAPSPLVQEAQQVQVAVVEPVVASNAAPSGNTVSFDAAMKVLEGLPKPVAAPRSARSKVKTEAKEPQVEKPMEPSPASVTEIANVNIPKDDEAATVVAPSSNTVPFDAAIKMLEGLPKPVAAPRSSRSRAKMETAPAERDGEKLSAPSVTAVDGNDAQTPDVVMADDARAATGVVEATPPPSSNTVPFDAAIKILEGLPKPVAAPRSSRSRAKVEAATAEGGNGVAPSTTIASEKPEEHSGPRANEPQAAIGTVEASVDAPSTNTVPFDAAMTMLEALPKPVAAPRSSRSLSRTREAVAAGAGEEKPVVTSSGTAIEEQAVQPTNAEEAQAADDGVETATAVPSANVVSFDDAMKMLEGLPKPVASPRSSRSRAKVETLPADGDGVKPVTPTLVIAQEKSEEQAAPVSKADEAPVANDGAETAVTAPSANTVPFDAAIKILEGLPKPVAAPRSSRSKSRTKEEVLAAESVDETPTAPSADTVIAKNLEETVPASMVKEARAGNGVAESATAAPSTNVVSFDDAMKMLEGLPKPVASPRSSRSRTKAESTSVGMDGDKPPISLPDTAIEKSDEQTPPVSTTDMASTAKAVEEMAPVAPTGNTVPFDAAMKMLETLPKPVAAPRSSRSLSRAGVEAVAVERGDEKSADASIEKALEETFHTSTVAEEAKAVNNRAEAASTNLVSFDDAMKMLEGLPKPVASPRSSRSRTKVESAPAEVVEEKPSAPLPATAEKKEELIAPLTKADEAENASDVLADAGIVSSSDAAEHQAAPLPKDESEKSSDAIAVATVALNGNVSSSDGELKFIEALPDATPVPLPSGFDEAKEKPTATAAVENLYAVEATVAPQATNATAVSAIIEASVSLDDKAVAFSAAEKIVASSPDPLLGDEVTEVNVTEQAPAPVPATHITHDVLSFPSLDDEQNVALPSPAGGIVEEKEEQVAEIEIGDRQATASIKSLAGSDASTEIDAISTDLEERSTSFAESITGAETIKVDDEELEKPAEPALVATADPLEQGAAEFMKTEDGTLSNESATEAASVVAESAVVELTDKGEAASLFPKVGEDLQTVEVEKTGEPKTVNELVTPATVPFDAALKALDALPKPIPAPRAVMRRERNESEATATGSEPPAEAVNDIKIAEKASTTIKPALATSMATEASTVSFDAALKLLESLPKPVAAPRTIRRKAEETTGPTAAPGEVSEETTAGTEYQVKEKEALPSSAALSGQLEVGTVEVTKGDVPPVSEGTERDKASTNGIVTSEAVNMSDGMTSDAPVLAAGSSIRPETADEKPATIVPPQVGATSALDADAIATEATVPFDTVVQVLENLPKPVAAPRSSRSLRRTEETKEPVATTPAPESVVVEEKPATFGTAAASEPPRVEATNVGPSEEIATPRRDVTADIEPPQVSEASTANPAADVTKVTVPFETVVQVLGNLPKPVAAPRSSRTLRRTEEAREPEAPTPATGNVTSTAVVSDAQATAGLSKTDEPAATGNSNDVPISNTVPMETVFKVLENLPKPVPAPRTRSSRGNLKAAAAASSSLEAVPAADLPKHVISAQEEDASETKSIVPSETVPQVFENLPNPTPAPSDTVAQVLENLPKPVAAPRSSRSLKRTEDAKGSEAPARPPEYSVLEEKPPTFPPAAAGEPLRVDAITASAAGSSEETPKLVSASRSTVRREVASAVTEPTHVGAASTVDTDGNGTKATVPFDNVVQVLENLPKFVAAPRSSRSLGKTVEAKEPEAATPTLDDAAISAAVAYNVQSTAQPLKAEEPAAIANSNDATVSANTVPMETVFKVLETLPKPVPAPRTRSSRGNLKAAAVPSSAPEPAPTSNQPNQGTPAQPSGQEDGASATKSTVPFDTVLQVLENLPKPTPAPRSSRTLRKPME
ncbi:hypothetical protein HDU96_000326 [Phlyctochytrium bullatum]|nr:hypothetical protein HDU96_000326 [Phlyctochytrium bullatum]